MLQAARRSYRFSTSMVEPVNLILSSSLTTIRTLAAQLKPIEKAIAAELRATPPQTLSTIPGLGPVFTAGIVSEIGDVSRFEREESLAKFCGLTWRRHQSGEFEGEERPLSKTGNAYLRYHMVEAANSVRLVSGVRFLLQQEVWRGDAPQASARARTHGQEAGEARPLHAAERAYLPACRPSQSLFVGLCGP